MLSHRGTVRRGLHVVPFFSVDSEPNVGKAGEVVIREDTISGADGVVVAAVVVAFGPALVGLFHWLAVFSEIPASKSPPGLNLAQLRDLGLVLQAGPFSYAFAGTAAGLTLAALVAIPFIRGHRRWMQVLLGIELLAVPALLLASSGERNAAEQLIQDHFGAAHWVFELDGLPALLGVVCTVIGVVLLIRIVLAWRAER